MIPREAAWKTYQDFILKIERAGEGRYRAEAQGPAGEARSEFSLPLTDEELTLFMNRISGQQKASASNAIPEPMQLTVDLGTKLFDAVVQGRVRDVFVSARSVARIKGNGLRVQLRLNDAPELGKLPWECLYDGQDFLALSDATPIVRYLDLPNPPRPMKVDLPLRILVTISAPDDLEPLNVEAEKGKVWQALSSLESAGLVELDFMPDAMMRTLQRTLRQAESQDRPYHVWHYIGHGDYDPATQSGKLLFSDPRGKSRPIDGFQLGTLFNSYPQIRLVLLNACEGARSGDQDPFSGVSAALIERGIPAVVGMQFAISDQAAITFSEEFYAAMVDGLPVDSAVTEARRAIFFQPNWVEWATPVIFMRMLDGHLFELQNAPTSGNAKVAYLLGKDGAVHGWSFELDSPESLIGRTPDNDIVIPDTQVSRSHAKIEYRDDGFWVSDLGSRNGTLVNRKRITGSHRLEEGDKIQMGLSILVFTFDESVWADYGNHPTSIAGSMEEPSENKKTHPVENEQLFLPNKWTRDVLTATEQVVGHEKITMLLVLAELPHLLRSYPPDNLNKEVPFSQLGQLWESIYRLYGVRGASSVARIAGEKSFRAGLEHFKDASRISTGMMMKVGSLEARMRIGLEFLKKYFNVISDQKIEIDEDNDNWYWKVENSPICWGWTAQEPVCHLTVGMLQEAFAWASSGKSFRIVETDCRATGDALCVFRINKSPSDV